MVHGQAKFFGVAAIAAIVVALLTVRLVKSGAKVSLKAASPVSESALDPRHRLANPPSKKTAPAGSKRTGSNTFSKVRVPEPLARAPESPPSAPVDGDELTSTRSPVEVEPMLPVENADVRLREEEAPSGLFAKRIARASRANGKDPNKACLEWGRLCEHLLDSSATKEEKSLGYFNIAAACSRLDEHSRPEQRLARESLFRYAKFSGEPLNQKELLRLRESYKLYEKVRYQLVWVDVHEHGTQVVVDGELACEEPCVLAIPLDAKPHRLDFLGKSGSATVNWFKPGEQVLDPELPELQ